MKKIKCVVLGAADAGKTSLLRRYFYQKFQSTRLPTVGSDVYTQQVTLNEEDLTVLFHMWDTPGRELQRQEEEEHVDALLDAFVNRVDGILLVYDSSSSTSFTKLRLIYAHWLKKNQDSKQIPILVVGNKRDLSGSSGIKKQQQQQQPPTVPEEQESDSNNNNYNNHHRNVMGLETFKGKDFRYEYKVYHDLHHTNTNNTNNSVNNLNTPTTTKRKRSPQHRHEISTFSSTAGSGSMWTQDFSLAQDGIYLDSLLSSEDRSNPDRDMVQLWCMRNGLEHMEVSALQTDGNVNQAMERLLKLVLEYQQQQQQQQQLLNEEQQTTGDQHNLQSHQQRLDDIATSELTASTVIRPRKELDLHNRYGPKDNGKCCFGILPSCKTMCHWVCRIIKKVKKQ